MNPREIVVFLGPSLPDGDARRALRARYLPPVRCGDILRALRLRPRAIAIVDGVFESTAAVWHKEILLALEAGIPVFGAASMGALRAAELAPFGMVGIGRIFEAYRDGVYTDDDEVALLHGPAEYGYPTMSEPMVNVRATVAAAVRRRIIGPESGDRVIRCAKETFYQDRSLANVIERAWGTDADDDEPVRFRRYLARGGYVDQKRQDARRLVQHLASLSRIPAPPARPADPVNRSCFILKLHQDVNCGPFVSADGDLPRGEQVALEAARLGSTSRCLGRLAELMAIVHAVARAQGLAVTARDVARVYDHSDFGLGPAARTRRWAKLHDLNEASRENLVARLGVIRCVLQTSAKRAGRRQARRRQEAYLLDVLRLEGQFSRWQGGGHRATANPDRAVLHKAARAGGVEFGLYRRLATLWSIVDEAADGLGIAPTDTPQSLSDEFRRARGLDREAATLAWQRVNNLDESRYLDLVVKDARLSTLCNGSQALMLGYFQPGDHASWLLDAIRLVGLYTSLRDRLTVKKMRPAISGRPQDPDASQPRPVSELFVRDPSTRHALRTTDYG
jgi:hypothetical protein